MWFKRRLGFLSAGVIACWAVILVPLVLLAPAPEPPWLGVLQLLLCGLILGLGRQGIDVLAIRLVAASLALPASSAIWDLLTMHSASCQGLGPCFQVWSITVLFLAAYGSVVAGLIAVPVAVVSNGRHITSLKPEIAWPNSRPWWQWAILCGLIVLCVPLLGVLLGIPWPG